MNAIILHGQPSKEQYYDPAFPASSNYYWIPWLQKQLIIRDIHAATPDVPNNWTPNLATWRKEFERYDVNEETILVGHSCGAGFLVRWLSEHPKVNPAKVVLAAPWLNPTDREETWDFFKFEIDKNLAERTELVIVYSDDDMLQILDSVTVLRKALPKAAYKELHGMKHFYDDSRMTFPELLEVVL